MVLNLRFHDLSEKLTSNEVDLAWNSKIVDLCNGQDLKPSWRLQNWKSPFVNSILVAHTSKSQPFYGWKGDQFAFSIKGMGWTEFPILVTLSTSKKNPPGRRIGRVRMEAFYPFFLQSTYGVIRFKKPLRKYNGHNSLVLSMMMEDRNGGGDRNSNWWLIHSTK